jgi:glycine/D-amino acid oxidase-like deaminating enzyme
VQEERIDLAIIGAGILGASAAYLVNRLKPEWRIVLIDRSLAGQGATQHSVGLCLPYGHTELNQRLAVFSSVLFEQIRLEIPDLPLYSIPIYTINRRENAARLISCFTDKSCRIGDRADEAVLRRSYPDLVLSKDEVVLAGCDASYGFPQSITSLMISRLKQNETFSCWEGTEIKDVVPQGKGFSLLAADGRQFDTDRVLSATGPWLLHGPGKETVRNAAVRIKKVAALHVEKRPPADAPVLYFFDHDAFLLPVRQQQRWLYSFRSNEWDCAPEISRLGISAGDRILALGILQKYCPSLVQHCNGGRVFCDAYGVDRRPLFSRACGLKNWVLAGAGAGSGFRLAPGIAREALLQFSDFVEPNDHSLVEVENQFAEVS